MAFAPSPDEDGIDPVTNTALRRAQLRDEADAANATAEWDAPIGEKRAFRQGQDIAIDRQVMAERVAEINRRRQEKQQRERAELETAAYNSAAKADFEGSGREYYTDPLTKRLTPVREAGTGRDLYKEQTLGIEKDPKTGRPVRVKRNRYGERIVERPASLTASSDNIYDDNLYTTIDGESVPYMTIQEAEKDPDVKVRNIAAGVLRKRKAHEESRFAQMANVRYDGAKMAIDQAQADLAEVEDKMRKIVDPATGVLPPEQQAMRDALNQQRTALTQALNNQRGPLQLGLKQAEHERNIARSRALVVAFDDELAQMEEALAEGRAKDPAVIQDRIAEMKRSREIAAERLQQLTAPRPAPAPVAAPAPAEDSTLGGIGRVAKRAGLQAAAGMDVLGASARLGKQAQYDEQAARLEQQAAQIDTLQPNWTPENRQAWAQRALQTAQALRQRGAKMGESAGGQMASAADRLKRAAEITGSKVYEGYQGAKGWDAVARFLSDPVEISTNIAAEGAVGSVPSLAAGAAGGATGGVPGAMAGIGMGSFASEYANSLTEAMSGAGVDVTDPAALASAFQDPAIMADAQKRGLARGIPVALFDAFSGGIAGRTIRGGAKQAIKAGVRELGEQAGLGMAGEAAGQVSEQLATNGRVDGLEMGDIAAEGIGELVPGVGEIAGGAVLRRIRGQAPAEPRDQTEATPKKHGIAQAIADRLPVSKDVNPEALPKGYVLEGEQYVFRGESEGGSMAATIPAPPPSSPTPNFATATTQEIDAWAEGVRNSDRQAEEQVFGKNAEKYRKLQRIANSSSRSASDPAVKAADAQIAEMEAALTPEQQDILYGRTLPDGYIDPQEARRLRALVADIDSAESGADLARASSRILQGAMVARSKGTPIEGREAEILARVLRKAEQLNVGVKDLVRAAFAYRSGIEGDDVFELAGVTPQQLAEFLGESQPTNENAPEIQSPSAPALREAPENREGVRRENEVDQGAAGAEGAEEAVREVGADFDAEETASGTRYQYKLIKEGDMWTAKMRMVRSDGTTTDWDGPIGIGRHRERGPVAERFAERFPNAAATSSDPDIKGGHERITQRKAAQDRETETKKAEENARRERGNAYREQVRATPLKGKSMEVALKTGDGEGGATTRTVQAMVYGDWAVHKETRGRTTEYIVTHVPSGLRAQKAETAGQAKEIVQALTNAGVNTSSPSLNSDKESMKRIAQAVIALRDGSAPPWFDAEGGSPATPAPPSPTPAPQVTFAGIDHEKRDGKWYVVGSDEPVSAELAKKLEAKSKPRASDRAITALQKAKIGKPGRVLSADPFTLAYDAAIDLAILAIRAGRSVADAAKLASQRLRAKFPQATPEQVAQLEAAIRTAAEGPPPAESGKMKPSKLPESLKAAGAPAETIEYFERAQDARRAEAAAIIKRDGPQKAEAAISDPALPEDTRMAIGGQLLNERMLAFQNAKGADADRITRDIRRITAKMQPEATRMGQGISMLGGVLKDIRIAAAYEYVRDAQKAQKEALGGDPAQEAAQEVADAFNKTKDQAARDAAIERLKKRYSTKPVRRMLDALKTEETARKLKELGALTSDDLLNVAANALGIPGADAATLREISDLVDRIDNAKTPAEEAEARLELTKKIANENINKVDLEFSNVALNILFSGNTQYANASGTFMRLMSQLATTALVNPRQAGELLEGAKRGVTIGATEAKSIWQTGRSTRDFQDKTGGAGHPVERVDYAKLYPGMPKAIARALNVRARTMAQVGRFMRAADALAYYPAREAYARMTLAKLLEGEVTGDALKRRLDEALHTTPEAFESAKAQATAEGYSGISRDTRVYDIIEERRRETMEGAYAADEAEKFGAESTYTNEPEGLPGAIYRSAKHLVEGARIGGVPVLRPWMMFLRTPTNMVNASLNYLPPVGFTRAISGKTMDAKGETRHLTEDERNRLYAQASIGTALMAGATAAIAKGLLDVTFKGPEDREKREQLMAQGWRPYSFRIGNGPYIGYRDSPALIPLAVVGYVADAYKYNKDSANAFLGNRVADALLHAPLAATFSVSPLTALSDLMGAAAGQSGGAGTSIARTVTGLPAQAVIPGNRAIMELDRYLDPKMYDSNAVARTIPGVRRMGEVRTDIQGRPITGLPSDRFYTEPSKDRVDQLLAKKSLFIPGVSRTIRIGDEFATDEQITEYRRESGKRIRERLLADLGFITTMNREEAQEYVDDIAREERRYVLDDIRARAPVAR